MDDLTGSVAKCDAHCNRVFWRVGGTGKTDAVLNLGRRRSRGATASQRGRYVDAESDRADLILFPMSFRCTKGSKRSITYSTSTRTPLRVCVESSSTSTSTSTWLQVKGLCFSMFWKDLVMLLQMFYFSVLWCFSWILKQGKLILL